MAKTKQDGLVADFLIGQLPSRLLQAYKIIANLEYPIVDRHSLICQLDEIARKDKNSDKREKPALRLIKDQLEPVDFPMQTPSSGLEKFHARLSQSFIIEPPFPRPIGPQSPFTPDFGPFFARPERNILLEYINRFGLRCGFEAHNAYLEARGQLPDPDADEVNAYWTGLRVGRACSRR